MHSNCHENFEKHPESDLPLILVIDDDPDNLLFASCIIESLGLRYVVTNDGEECLNLVTKLMPNIVLLDIVMPKVNGLEITRKIKQDKNIDPLTIIAVTGLTRLEDRQKIIEAGCDDYICKPYMIEELETKICSYLDYRFAEAQK